MKVGVDIDDVVVDFMGGFLEFCNLKLNKSLCLDDWGSYFLYDVYGVSKQKELEIVEEFHNSDRFEKLGLIGGAKEGVGVLQKNHKLILITSRKPIFKEMTREFIKKHFGEGCFEIFHSINPDEVKDMKKSDICVNENVDLLIEDNQGYALEVAQQGITVLLLDKPWNKNVEHENIRRVEDWEGIVSEINKMESEK
jgi:uncharacterized HAD superfamily protein